VAAAAWDQDWICASSAILAFAAVLERTRQKYGARAERYVTIEIGHATQNVHLQAETLALGTVVVGAFHDDRARDAIGARADEVVLALMPVGRR
jgi:SagB-type dehydrogenase family enzyme